MSHSPPTTPDAATEAKPRPSPASIRARVYELMWPRRGKLLLGLALLLVGRLAGLVPPGAVKYLVDEVIGKERLELFWPILLTVGAAVTTQALCSFALTQLLARSAQRLIAELRIKVQRHVGRLPVRYHDQNKVGVLVSRIMTDAEGVRNVMGTGLVELLGGLVTAAVALAVLVHLNAPLTFGALGFLAAFSLIVRRAFRVLRPIFKERGRIHAEVTGRLTETLGGIRVVKGFRAEEREAGVFAEGVMRLYDNVKRTLLTTSLLGLSSTLLMGLVGAIVMGVGTRQILAGHMTIGDLFAYTLYLALLVAPVFQVVGVGSQLQEAFAGLERIEEVLREQPEELAPGRIHPLPHVTGEIRFEDVEFSYAPGEPVLKGVSFVAPPGTVTALVGPSGSGKSTIISLVAAFESPTAGRVLLDGVDLATIRLAEYRGVLGLVLQESFLFDGTIRDNIAFGRPQAPSREIQEAARLAHVQEFAERFEKGLDTLVGERGVKLSGGQRQRVSIARAILCDPRILVLDEATSTLDSESEAYIQAGLKQLMRGRTTFVIAHRLSTVTRADQILFIESGRIAERGNHEELLARQGRYHDLYSRQAGFDVNLFLNEGETASAEANGQPEEASRPEAAGSPLELLRGRRL